MRHFYFWMAVFGTVVPWVFFSSYFASNGFVPISFVADLFANGATGGFSADVLISILVFWVWSHQDAKKHAISGSYWVLPAGFCVGLSSALPLYLWLREPQLNKT